MDDEIIRFAEIEEDKTYYLEDIASYKNINVILNSVIRSYNDNLEFKQCITTLKSCLSLMKSFDKDYSLFCRRSFFSSAKIEFEKTVMCVIYYTEYKISKVEEEIAKLDEEQMMIDHSIFPDLFKNPETDPETQKNKQNILDRQEQIVKNFESINFER